MSIKIGADPELFVYTQEGKPCSAANLMVGNKYYPHKVDKGAIQVDGVAAEFNIEPAETEEEFFHNIVAVEHQMLAHICQHGSYILRATPTIKFTRKQWAALSEEEKMLGCEPDYSAYSMTHNPIPKTDKFMRTGSGHIHISWGDQTDDPTKPVWLARCAGLVKHLDYHLAANATKWDNDKERMELYGRAGAFRPKPYGVEYRVLSNAWVAEEKRIKYVFRIAKAITEKWQAGCVPGDYSVEAYA